MFLATRNLIGSCCRWGSNVMAVSASMASVLIQFFGLEWMLNFRPFCRSSSSSLVKCILVWFSTRGKNACSGLVSSLPRLVRCLSLFLKVWYLLSIVGVKDSCIEVCMVGHIGPQSLEA